MPLGYEKEKKANAKSRVGEHEEGLWSPEIAWETCKMENVHFMERSSMLITCLEDSTAPKGLRTTGSKQ